MADIHNSTDKVIIVDSIIKLAQEFDMNVIADGIETEEQLNYLVSKNCHIGQGSFLQKPLTAALFEKLAYQQLIMSE